MRWRGPNPPEKVAKVEHIFLKGTPLTPKEPRGRERGIFGHKIAKKSASVPKVSAENEPFFAPILALLTVAKPYRACVLGIFTKK